MIACVVIPDFVFTIEKKKPDWVAEEMILTSEAGMVQAATLGAVRQGVRLGMRMGQAHARCPEAQVFPFDAAPYEDIAGGVEETLRNFTVKVETVAGFWQRKRRTSDPLVKHPSAAIFYLDLGALRTKDGLELAHRIGDTLSATYGLDAHIGLARGKFPASVATRVASPQQPKCIRPGEERAFLAPFPVSLLPLKKEIGRRLNLFGVHTIGDLARLPKESIIAQFGKDGRLLHELSQGNDPRPVRYVLPKPMERITRQFDPPIEDRHELEAVLKAFGCELAERVRNQGYAIQKIELVLHCDRGAALRPKHALREPTQDGKLVGRGLVRLLALCSIASGIVGIEVTARDLAPVQWQQLDLFASSNPLENRLSDLLTALTERFGEDSVVSVSVVDREDGVLERRFSLAAAEVA